MRLQDIPKANIFNTASNTPATSPTPLSPPATTPHVQDQSKHEDDVGSEGEDLIDVDIDLGDDDEEPEEPDLHTTSVTPTPLHALAPAASTAATPAAAIPAATPAATLDPTSVSTPTPTSKLAAPTPSASASTTKISGMTLLIFSLLIIHSHSLL